MQFYPEWYRCPWKCNFILKGTDDLCKHIQIEFHHIFNSKCNCGFFGQGWRNKFSMYLEDLCNILFLLNDFFFLIFFNLLCVLSSSLNFPVSCNLSQPKENLH